jgi:hypothetical protein
MKVQSMQTGGNVQIFPIDIFHFYGLHLTPILEGFATFSVTTANGLKMQGRMTVMDERFGRWERCLEHREMRD